MTQIVTPSYEVLEYPRDVLQRIERAARTCYKSEDKITDGSAEKLVRNLLKRGHMAMIEFGGSASVRFVSNRGFTHELVRHRLCSFAQESTRYCVAGSSVLSMKNPHQRYTVAELYQNKITSTNGAWKRMGIRQLDEETGELVYAEVQDVVLVGIRPVVTITTRLGYALTLTPDHPVRVEDGYLEAGDLFGKRIAVNGTELAYQNQNWLFHQYNTLGKTAEQVAKEFGWTASRAVHARSLKVVHFDEVVSVEEGSAVEVYDLVMGEPNRNFVANGVVVHNCNYAKSKFGSEITVCDPTETLALRVTEGDDRIAKRARWKLKLLESWARAENDYLDLTADGCPAEIAREVLPIGVKAEIVIEANVREWSHIFSQRAHHLAHPRMRELMVPLLRDFRKLMPVIFDDLVPKKRGRPTKE